jgi:hypothetical protein
MTPQKFSNHTRWHAPFHFFILPVMLLNVGWSVGRFVVHPSVDTAWLIILSLALASLMAFVRTYPLKAQDRLIRLEERIRYRELLPPEIANHAEVLKINQIVALRFAADDELEKLVRAVLSGELAKPVEIKRAITNWRPDTFRV